MIGEKKSTLERILLSATSLFLEKGYEGVGLREITAKADVTTGAFYRHFKGKAELFEALVGETYHTLMKIYLDTLSSFFATSAETQMTSMRDITLKTVDRMTSYMYEHETEMTLILCKSEGTEFSDLAGELARIDANATDEFTENTRTSGIEVKDVNKELEILLTEGMFSTYLELIRKKLPREEMDRCAHTIIDFYEAGWWKIMGL